MAKSRNPGDMFSFSFDFSSLSFGGMSAESEREEIPRLSLEPVCFENAEAMADAIDYEKDYFCLVSGSFIFGDFIEALCFKKRLNPSVVYMTTLGMGKPNVDSIVNLVDCLKCQKVNLIVSHYFAGTERNGMIPYMENEFCGKPVNVAVLQSHCKICVIRSGKGDIVISGSANLSSSNNVEQFTIMHSAELVTYVQGRLDDIMDKFTVIKGLDGARFDYSKNKKNTGKHAYKIMTGDDK